MSDVTCPNCHGKFTTGCWMCHPEANPVPIEISVPPPIPLPEFDPWEQLRFARDRIRELEAESQTAWNTCDIAESALRAAEAKLARVDVALNNWGWNASTGFADTIRKALKEPEHEQS